jgi:hypothetical protein
MPPHSSVFFILADFVVLLHLTFVLFVIFGGLLVLKWPRAAWVHLPAAAWGAAVEFGGWLCPLTYLENWLRGLGGQVENHSDFVGRFLLPILYPPELTRTVQITLGLFVIVINLVIYRHVWKSHAPRRPHAGAGADL